MLDSSNSWVTLDYANTYFSNKYGASFWAPLSNTEKESLLITSKNFILQNGYSIEDDNEEIIVKNAQCETAQFYYEFYEQWKKRANLIASGVTSFRVLNFNESLSKVSLPSYISQLLFDYKSNTGNFFGMITREND